MEIKPIPHLAAGSTTTTETEADVIVPAGKIKQEPAAVEQEYFEDVALGQSERQSSDLSQSCAGSQTDRDCSTEVDSQAEDSAFESHRKKHRREATKRQRSLKKRIKSKYKNINSGASMMYSFVADKADTTIMDTRNFNEIEVSSVPHCPQINYTPTTPRKAKDINAIVRGQLARRAQSRLEKRRQPAVEQKSPRTPEKNTSKEICGLRDGLHEFFSSEKVRRRVDAKVRRQLPMKKSKRFKDRRRKNALKVNANPLIRSQHPIQKSPVKQNRGMTNNWSRLQRDVENANDSEEEEEEKEKWSEKRKNSATTRRIHS